MLNVWNTYAIYYLNVHLRSTKALSISFLLSFGAISCETALNNNEVVKKKWKELWVDSVEDVEEGLIVHYFQIGGYVICLKTYYVNFFFTYIHI